MRISPELSFQSGTFGYVRTQIDGSFYQPIGDRVVLAGRARVGTIWGADRDTIAPSRRFYAGGGGTVRGYCHLDIGMRGANDDTMGRGGLAELSVEGRSHFGNIGGVRLLAAGNNLTA